MGTIKTTRTMEHTKECLGASKSAPMLARGKPKGSRTPGTTPEEWLRRVGAVQSANCTPEVLAQAKMRRDRQASMMRKSKKASMLQMSNAMCQRTWCEGAKSMSAVMANPAKERAAGLRQSSMEFQSRMTRVNASISKASPMLQKEESDSDDEDDMA